MARIIWIYGIFYPIEAMRTIIRLYMSYPISWGIAIVVFAVIVQFAFKKLRQIDRATKKAQTEDTALGE